jgi:hypothetical protein
VKAGRFNDLLKDPILFAAFEEFLGREFAQENLQFFRDVVNFETETAVADKKQVKKQAEAICAKYLGLGATNPQPEQALNLNLRQISTISNNLKKKPTNKLFLEARMDIEQLLRTKYISFCDA